MQATKQEKLAHVILATSDYFFINWLAKGEPSMLYRSFVLKA